MQKDGNAIVRDGDGNEIWSTKTINMKVSYLKMQQDGNLVIYSNVNKPVWACCIGLASDVDNLQTSKNINHKYSAPYELVIKNSGSLIIQDMDKIPYWKSPGPTGKPRLEVPDYVDEEISVPLDNPISSPNGNWVAVLHADGLHLFNWQTGEERWSTSGAHTNTASYYVLGKDGNLVIFDANRAPLWGISKVSFDSNLRYKLYIKNNGKLIVQNSNNIIIWSSP